MPDKKKALIPAYLSVAFVWFATHAGGGFCTGRQEVEYYVQYGKFGLAMPFVAIGICAFIFGICWEIARLYKVYNYRALADEVYRPYHQLFSNVFELAYALVVVMATSAGIAACGHLLEQLLSIHYLLGIVLSGAVILLVVQYGAPMLRRAGTIMSIAIIAMLLVIIGLLLGPTAAERSQTLATVNNPGWAWKGFLYAMFQMVAIGAYVGVSDVLETRKDVWKAALWGFIVNAVVLWLIVFVLMGMRSDVLKEPLPLLYGIKKLGTGFSWLVTLYSLQLYLGNLSTAVSFVFGTVNRLESTRLKDTALFKNVILGRWISGAAILAVCVFIANYGLIAIVAKGYSFLGYVAIVAVAVPVVLIGLPKVLEKKA